MGAKLETADKPETGNRVWGSTRLPKSRAATTVPSTGEVDHALDNPQFRNALKFCLAGDHGNSNWMSDIKNFQAALKFLEQIGIKPPKRSPEYSDKSV